MSSFGKRLKMARVSRDLTLNELASTSTVSMAHLSDLERDQASPTLRMIELIAPALGLSPADLISDSAISCAQNPASALRKAADEALRMSHDLQALATRYFVESERLDKIVRIPEVPEGICPINRLRRADS